MANDQERLKRLDLLGSIGAGVLGGGIALLFAQWLKPIAIPALLIGMAAHGWAMFAKGRLEKQLGNVRPPWAVAAEWVCWLLLAALLVYILWALQYR